MNFLARLLAPARSILLLSVTLAAVTVLAGVGLMATSAYLISRAGQGPATLLLLLAPIAGVRFFSLLRAASRYVERLLTHDATFRLLARLKVLVFRRVERVLPMALLTTASGDWLRRLSADVDRLERLYSDGLAPLGVLLLTGGAVAAWLAPYGHGLAWAVVLGLLATAVLVPLAGERAVRRTSDALVTVQARFAARLVAALEGMADLLMSGQSDRVSQLLADDDRRIVRRVEELDRTGAVTTGLVALLSGLTGWAVLLLALPAVRRGALPGVELGMVVLGAVAAFEAAKPLAQSFHTLGESLAAGQRVLGDDDAAAPSCRTADAPPTQALPVDASIEVRSLSVRYAPDLPRALDHVSFQLPAGAHVAVIGPSGGGKSSLAHVLARLVPPEEGTILLGGAPLDGLDEAVLRREVAVLEQRPHLFATTVADNVRLGRPDAPVEDVWAALSIAALDTRVAALPEGLDSRLGPGGLLLSGGEQRRLALARVIVTGAPIWVLDEPLAGLDEATADAVAHGLWTVSQGRTILWITHDPVPVWTFDAVWRVDNGTLREIPAATAFGPIAGAAS